MVVVLNDAETGATVVNATRWQRVAARILAFRLDLGLIRGESPDASVLLALRARRLVAVDYRTSLARALAVVIEEASGRHRVAGAVAANASAIRANKVGLLALVERLRAPAPVPARGVACVRHLLTDGAGPLFYPRTAGQLKFEIERAFSGLEPLNNS